MRHQLRYAIYLTFLCSICSLHRSFSITYLQSMAKTIGCVCVCSQISYFLIPMDANNKNTAIYIVYICAKDCCVDVILH